MALTLPTHITAQEVRENSQNTHIVEMWDAQLEALIYNAEQVVFRYLGVWMYKNPIRYIPSLQGGGQTQFVDQGDAGSNMPVMPDPMKLAVILVMGVIFTRWGGGTNGGGMVDKIASEEIGDHKVSYTQSNVKNNYQSFITPDIESLLFQYTTSGRFISL